MLKNIKLEHFKKRHVEYIAFVVFGSRVKLIFDIKYITTPINKGSI